MKPFFNPELLWQVVSSCGKKLPENLHSDQVFTMHSGRIRISIVAILYAYSSTNKLIHKKLHQTLPKIRQALSKIPLKFSSPKSSGGPGLLPPCHLRGPAFGGAAPGARCLPQALGGFHWRLAVVQLLFLVFSVFLGGFGCFEFFSPWIQSCFSKVRFCQQYDFGNAGVICQM